MGCPAFTFLLMTSSSYGLFVPLSMTETPHLEFHSHSDNLNINTASILQHTLFWVTWNNNLFTAATNLYLSDSPGHNIHICNTLICPWRICALFSLCLHTLSSSMCTASPISMKVHDSWSVALSHALKLCELILIWCFPIISISLACWELCFVFLPSTWNNRTW